MNETETETAVAVCRLGARCHSAFMSHAALKLSTVNTRSNCPPGRTGASVGDHAAGQTGARAVVNCSVRRCTGKDQGNGHGPNEWLPHSPRGRWHTKRQP